MKKIKIPNVRNFMAVEDGPLKKAIRQSLIDNNLREAEPHEISKSRKVALKFQEIDHSVDVDVINMGHYTNQSSEIIVNCLNLDACGYSLVALYLAFATAIQEINESGFAYISLKENNGVTIKSDSLGLSCKGLVESEFVKDDIFNIDDVIDWYFIK